MLSASASWRTKVTSRLGGRRLHTAVGRVAGKQLRLETGRLCPLAEASVFAQMGDSSVLCTVVTGEQQPPGMLPLQVDVRDNDWASGFMPTTALRKQMSATDEEVLAARYVDRSIRPLFPKGFRHETQVVVNVTSTDDDTTVDHLAITAASAALQMSSAPWGPALGAVHVGWVGGQPVINPNAAQRAESQLQLLFAGTEDRCVMLEVEATELPEESLIAAMQAAQAAMPEVVAPQTALAAAIARPAKRGVEAVDPTVKQIVTEAVESEALALFEQATTQGRGLDRFARSAGIGRLTGLAEAALAKAEIDPNECGCGDVVDAVVSAAMRTVLLRNASAPVGGRRQFHHRRAGEPVEVFAGAEQAGLAPRTLHAGSPRIDGRRCDEVRELQVEAAALPVVHGSSIFGRGSTQALCTATLAPPALTRLTRSLAGPMQEQRFFLHYDFPPYATNETGRVGGPNRRMVGHGALAEKAVAPMLPSLEAFPYAVRVTSEITGSDGSSSMASVCGASLALMDAGVPLRRPVAGISVGLVTPPGFSADAAAPEQDRSFMLLTDILGMEDHLGDMDFKVAGTSEGVTALQMDIKLAGGVPLPVLEAAVWEATRARGHILGRMAETLPEPRARFKPSSLRMSAVTVDDEYRQSIVGPGGAMKRKIESETGATLRVDVDSPEVLIWAPNERSLAAAEAGVHAAVDARKQVLAAGLGSFGKLGSAIAGGARSVKVPVPAAAVAPVAADGEGDANDHSSSDDDAGGPSASDSDSDAPSHPQRRTTSNPFSSYPGSQAAAQGADSAQPQLSTLPQRAGAALHLAMPAFQGAAPTLDQLVADSAKNDEAQADQAKGSDRSRRRRRGGSRASSSNNDGGSRSNGRGQNPFKMAASQRGGGAKQKRSGRGSKAAAGDKAGEGSPGIGRALLAQLDFLADK